MRNRCSWVNEKNELYISYHDHEWGVPVCDDRLHFEILCLEMAQAGLSWETVLNKRLEYKKCFANFNPQKVAKFSEKKVNILLSNPKIIRHRLKIESTINNAKCFLKIQKEFGSFNNYIWNYVGNKSIIQRHKKVEDYPTRSQISDAISKDLKKRGMKFIGSTIVYSYMQAVGLTRDHHPKCFLY